MRKSLIFALLTLFTLSMVMVSCDNNNDPNVPENRRPGTIRALAK